MKGILFTEILFNKTIRKEKTMTRREHGLKVINNHQSDFIGFYHPVEEYFYASNGKGIDLKIAPTYKAGEVVYIKEPWAAVYYDESGGGDIIYKYDFPESERHLHKWSNKLFTGADKARYYVRITSVKVERLYDISDEDCLKEGVDAIPTNRRKEDIHLCEIVYPDYEQYKPNSTVHQRYEYTYSPKISFFSLFRFANRVPKSKEVPNIWCFVYSYVLCDKEGNEI